MIPKPLACLALAAAVATAAQAEAAESACVHFSGGWVRLPAMADMPMAAGFGHVRNDCKADVAVTAASSDAFKSVSMHETTVADGVSKMRELDRLPVAAGQDVELRPGGLHLMLSDGIAPLQEGQRVPLRLELSDGTQVRGEMVARKP